MTLISFAIAMLVVGIYGLALTLFAPGKKTDPGYRSPRNSMLAYEQGERARMPQEIANGRLVISERTFYRRGPRPIAAKTDQAFLTREGWLVLVESKTRRKVSSSDIVQVSCQSLAIGSQEKGRWQLATWAYIRLAPAGGIPTYQRVDLLHESHLDRLWDRWFALKHHRARAIARPKAPRCRTCLLRHQCPAAILK